MGLTGAGMLHVHFSHTKKHNQIVNLMISMGKTMFELQKNNAIECDISRDQRNVPIVYFFEGRLRHLQNEEIRRSAFLHRSK